MEAIKLAYLDLYKEELETALSTGLEGDSRTFFVALVRVSYVLVWIV